jgi:hypothetical protein
VRRSSGSVMTLAAPQMSRIRGTRAWMVAAMGPSPAR